MPEATHYEAMVSAAQCALADIEGWCQEAEPSPLRDNIFRVLTKYWDNQYEYGVITGRRAPEVENLRELLGQVLDEVDPLRHPGLTQDIAYALGVIKRWTCQDCGCVNGYHEDFCYRCGAGPEEEA